MVHMGRLSSSDFGRSGLATVLGAEGVAVARTGSGDRGSNGEVAVEL